MQMQTILVVEDEKSIADVLLYNLEKEGFAVQWERDGRDGLLRAQDLLPDLRLVAERTRAARSGERHVGGLELRDDGYTASLELELPL